MLQQRYIQFGPQILTLLLLILIADHQFQMVHLLPVEQLQNQLHQLELASPLLAGAQLMADLQ